MKVRCLLIGVVALFVAGVLTASSYARIDPKTCVGMWLFDEGKGDVAKDSSENGKDGTLMNKPKWVDGKFGKALEFDGINAYVDCGMSAPDLLGTDFTISLWIYKHTDDPSWVTVLVANHSGLGYSFEIAAELCGAAKGKLILRFQEGFAAEANTVLNNNIWYHVAVTYNWKTKTATYYVNGALDGARTSTVDLQASGGHVFIAARVGGAYAYDGLIDEVGIFNVALAQGDIENIMNNGIERALGLTPVFPKGKLTTVWGEIKAK